MVKHLLMSPDTVTDIKHRITTAPPVIWWHWAKGHHCRDMLV